MTDHKNGVGVLPDWWQREKQRRQLRVLLLLGLLLALIAYYYYINAQGRTGIVGGITGDTTDRIAFIRQEADGSTTLYSVRADGTDLQPLTPSSDKSDKSAPAWTIDGKHLLYASNKQDSRKTQIYILGAGDPTQLTYGPERKDSPLGMPDGQHVAFITQGAIKTVFLNGEDVIQLLPEPRSGNEENADSATPGELNPMGPYLNMAFSTDGAGVAGVQELSVESANEQAGYSAGDQVVRALPAGGTRALLLSVGRYASMAWEPNGNRLLASYAELPVPMGPHPTTVAGGLSLWSFDKPNQPVERRLLICKGYGFMPRNVAWSPKGDVVACEVWILKSEGEREQRGILLIRLPQDTGASGSTPDPSVRGLVMMKLPGETVMLPGEQSRNVPVMALPPGAQGIAANPKWSPDGSRLMFQVIRPDHKSDLWVVNADGTNPINLTKGVGDNTQGVWSPAKK
jgi:hypothetical protein